MKYFLFGLLVLLGVEGMGQEVNDENGGGNAKPLTFNFCQSDATIREVSFFGNHSIWSDSRVNKLDPTGQFFIPSGVHYTAPHWVDANNDGDLVDFGDRKYPICYTRNSLLRISAVLSIEEIPTGAEVKVKATTNIGLSFAEMDVEIFDNANEDFIFYGFDSQGTPTPVLSNQSLVNEVNAYEDLEVTWWITFDGGQTWENAGTSKNTLYVTLDNPIYGQDGIETFLFHTVVHIGCKNATGETGEATIVTKIYEEFTDQCVSKVNSEQCMTYYGNPDTPEDACYSTDGLLTFEDGYCEAWALFFRDIVRIQGIANVVKSGISYTADFALSQDTKDAFLIDLENNLELTEDDITIGFSATTGTMFHYFLVNDWDIDESLPTFSVTDEVGLAAQGNDDPTSFFPNHAIIKYTDSDNNHYYFDPSYGTGPFDESSILESQKMWENTSYAGNGIRFRIDDTGEIKYWVQGINNLTEKDLIFTQ